MLPFSTGERLKCVKLPDNLKPEGSIAWRPKSSWVPGDRSRIIKHPDNLTVEGDFSKRVLQPVVKSVRPDLSRREDNLKLVGVVGERIREPWVPVERTKLVKYPDNLRPGGESARFPSLINSSSNYNSDTNVSSSKRHPSYDPGFVPEKQFENPSLIGNSQSNAHGFDSHVYQKIPDIHKKNYQDFEPLKSGHTPARTQNDSLMGQTYTIERRNFMEKSQHYQRMPLLPTSYLQSKKNEMLNYENMSPLVTGSNNVRPYTSKSSGRKHWNLRESLPKIENSTGDINNFSGNYIISLFILFHCHDQ